MNDFAGIKELYDVNLRLNRPLEIGGKKYDINESILSFKSAELAQINEQKTSKQARGGLYNQVLIDWTIDKEMPFAMQHGVLSPTSWALLSNSKLQGQKEKSVGITEELHTLEDEQYCCVELKFWPNCIERLGAQPNPDFMPHPQGRRPELMLKPLPPSKTKWLFCYDMAKVEISAFKDGKWIRVAGELVEDDRIEAQKSMLDAYPELGGMYQPGDGNTVVYYFKNAVATICSFTAAPEVIRF